MRETRQIFGYVFGLAIVLVATVFAVRYGLLEAVQYLPAPNGNVPRFTERAELEQTPVVRDADAQPVWVVPTAKYHYDPKLMEVKPREELMQEAQRRRAKEFASFQAKSREAQLKRERNLRQAREAFAAVPAQRLPAFLSFTVQ